MAESKLPKQVQAQGDKSKQAENTINPHEKSASGSSENVDEDFNKPVDLGDPDAPYGDAGTKPEDVPMASDPDPEIDPYVSRDAAQPIGTGREDQAVAERKAMDEQETSPEFEADQENRRVHGAHHERYGGRPLESFAAPVPVNDPHRPADNIAGLNPHTSNYSKAEDDEGESKRGDKKRNK